MNIECFLFLLILASVEMYPITFIKAALKYIQIYSRLDIGNVFALLHQNDVLKNDTFCEDIRNNVTQNGSNIFFQCVIWSEGQKSINNTFQDMLSPSLLLFFGHETTQVIAELPKNMLIDNIGLIIIDEWQSRKSVETLLLGKNSESIFNDIALLDSQIYIMLSVNTSSVVLYEMYRKCWNQPIEIVELSYLTSNIDFEMDSNFIWEKRKHLSLCTLRIAYFNTGYVHEMRNDTIMSLKDMVHHEFQYHKRHTFHAGGKIMYGYGMILLNTLKDEFNFSVEWKFVDDKKFGALVPGSTTNEWNGIVGMLKRNEVDTSSLWLSITDARSTVISFAVPIVNIEYQLIMKRPVISLSWATYITVFHISYWILLVLLFVTCSLYFGYIFTRLEHNSSNLEDNRLWKLIGDNVISGFAAMSLALGALDINLSKPSVNLRLFMSLRILAFVVCLFGIVNYYIYNAGLIARVMAHHPNTPINELDDLLHRNEYTLLIQEGSAQESYLRHTKEYKKIWENSRKRNGLIGNENVNEGEQKIRRDPKKVFFVEYPLFQVMDQHARRAWLMNDTHHGSTAWTDPCELFAAKKRYGLNSISFAFQQNSPYIKLFNYHIRQIKEKGLATEAFNPNNDADECGKENNGNQFRSFSNDDVFSAFVVCAFGCLAAVAYCIFEKVKHYYYKIMQHKHSHNFKRVKAIMKNTYLMKLAFGSNEKHHI